MSFDEIKPFLDYGILGTIVFVLGKAYFKLVNKIIEVVQNNTKALENVKETMNKCYMNDV